MSLEVLERLPKDPRFGPRFRVRCSMCGDVYVTRQCQTDIEAREGCRSCSQREQARRKLLAPAELAAELEGVAGMPKRRAAKAAKAARGDAAGARSLRVRPSVSATPLVEHPDEELRLQARHKLVDLMHGGDPQVQLHAARALLEAVRVPNAARAIREAQQEAEQAARAMLAAREKQEAEARDAQAVLAKQSTTSSPGEEIRIQ